MEEEFKKYKDLAIQNLAFGIDGIVNGNSTSQTINNELQRFEGYLNNFESNKFKKNAYNIMVDLIQNTFRHGIDGRNCKIILGRDSSLFIFLSENLIIKNDILKIRDAIDPVNEISESREDLNNLYKKILLFQDDLLVKRRKGIGIIDLIRKSRNKLLYHFTDINENESLFSLIVRIEKES